MPESAMVIQHLSKYTAEDAIDSKWVIGSPTYLTTLLK